MVLWYIGHTEQSPCEGGDLCRGLLQLQCRLFVLYGCLWSTGRQRVMQDWHSRSACGMARALQFCDALLHIPYKWDQPLQEAVIKRCLFCRNLSLRLQ